MGKTIQEFEEFGGNRDINRKKNKFYRRGLYFTIGAKGKKYWYMKVMRNGRQTTIALGGVSSKEAFVKQSEIRLAISKNQYLFAQKCQLELLKDVAMEWYEKLLKYKWSPNYAKKVLNRMERHIFPVIGGCSIKKITRSEINKMLEDIQVTSESIANRIYIILKLIFEYAEASGKITTDPTSRLGSFFPRPIGGNYSAITNPIELGRFLKKTDGYKGTYTVKCALQIVVHIFLRSSELRLGRWTEIDFENSVWRVPVQRLKRPRKYKERYPNDFHIVPLSTQVIMILNELYQWTGHSEFVFPSERNHRSPISDATLTKAVRQLGYGKDVLHIHGFRSTAMTLIQERFKTDKRFIDKQLDHAIKDPLKKAYDRTVFLEDRALMMQDWSDYLDQLKSVHND